MRLPWRTPYGRPIPQPDGTTRTEWMCGCCATTAPGGTITSYHQCDRHAPAPGPNPGRAPAPGPVPGQLPPMGTAASPARPAPAPAPPIPTHTAGPISFIVYGWECGCELDFDGTGRVIWATGCGRSKQDDFEDFLKGLTDDQH